MRLIQHRSLLLRRLGSTDPQLQRNTVVTLRLALPAMHGLLIRSGQTLSIWRRVGRPTARRGFLPAVQRSLGQVSAGVGGGLCQLANLIHWMGLCTLLALVERHPRSVDPFPDEGRVLPFRHRGQPG